MPQGYPSYPPYSAYVQQPGFSDESEQVIPFTTRFRFDTNQGEGLGWGEGYTSFSGFIPWDFNGANKPPNMAQAAPGMNPSRWDRA